MKIYITFVKDGYGGMQPYKADLDLPKAQERVGKRECDFSEIFELEVEGAASAFEAGRAAGLKEAREAEADAELINDYK